MTVMLGQTDRQTDRLTDRQTGRQTDRSAFEKREQDIIAIKNNALFTVGSGIYVFLPVISSF